MKIAICLSGLPRTGLHAADFILPYFDLPGVQVDYFCHMWDNNLIKQTNGPHISQPIARSELEAIMARFNPVDSRIESQSVLDNWPNMQLNQYNMRNHWCPLFYSCMMANYMKRRHEQTTGERYDIVFKARYDSVFKPGTKYRPPPYEPMEIHTTHGGNFPYEFNRKNFSDVIFAGSSETMDIACDYFRYIAFHATRDDEHLVGPGVGLHKYMNDRNITPKITLDYETILRPEALADLSWPNIVDVHLSFYK